MSSPMRRFVLIGIMIVFSIAPGAMTATSPKVAVLQFKSLMADAALGEAVTELLKAELVDTGAYQMVERGAMNQILKEQAFQQSGVVDPQKAVAIGKLTGADLMVYGSVIKTGDLFTISSRIIDIESGAVTVAKSIRGSGEERIPDLVRQLALNIKQTAHPLPPILYSFELQTDDLSQWIPNDADNKAIQISRAMKFATHGEFALQADLPAHDYPGLVCRSLPSDWSAYKHLRADLFFEKGISLNLIMGVRIDDDQSDSHETRFYWDLKPLKGLNRIEIPVDKIRRRIDVHRIKEVHFYLDDPDLPVTLYLDRVGLE